MVPDCVVLHAQFELRHQNVALSRTHFAVVLADFFREGPCLPSLRSRQDDSSRVNRSFLGPHIATDGFETFAAKQLARPGHVFGSYKTVVVGLTRGTRRAESGSDDPNRGITSEFPSKNA